MFSPGWKQYLAGLSAAFGAICLGLSLGWSGPVESKYKDGSSGYSFTPNNDEWGWISSLITLGAAFICIPIGFLIKMFGRKITMLVMVIPYVIGWCLILFAQNIYMAYCGRFVIGACGGSFCVSAPMYTTEVAEVDKRGMMGCFYQLLLVFGILIVFILSAFLDVKMLNAVCSVTPILFFLILIWMPESPVYLMQKGKTERAESAMRFLRGKDTDLSAELQQMAADANKEKAKAIDIIKRKATLKGLFIAVMLMFFQQFSGVNAILFYATEIFRNAKTGISATMCTVLLGVIMLTSTLAAIFIIDRVGRKILLFISALVMALTTILMACHYQWLQKNNIGWLAVLAILLYNIAFAVGYGPVPWLLMAELFAEDAKTVAGAIAGTTNWLFAFCITKLFPLCVSEFGEAFCFLFFAIISLLALIFVLIFVPETKGKTLNEIQEKLE